MRHSWRQLAGYREAGALLLSAVCFLSSACSLPEVTFSKRGLASERANITSFTGGGSNVDKRYLSTVHIRFSESKDIPPISFDIRKDKRNMIAAKLFESEETKTVLHLGYTRGDGPIVGCLFNWKF